MEILQTVKAPVGLFQCEKGHQRAHDILSVETEVVETMQDGFEPEDAEEVAENVSQPQRAKMVEVTETKMVEQLEDECIECGKPTTCVARQDVVFELTT